MCECGRHLTAVSRQEGRQQDTQGGEGLQLPCLADTRFEQDGLHCDRVDCVHPAVADHAGFQRKSARVVAVPAMTAMT